MVESGAAGLGASLAPALLPGFVVAATGDVVFIGFGGWGGLGTPGLAEPGLPSGARYAVSLGCGFRGGPIFPAIYLGIAVIALPVVWFDISPTVAVAIGAAAGMAAMTRLLLTPMPFAALLVGLQGVDTVPAAVLAASARGSRCARSTSACPSRQ